MIGTITTAALAAALMLPTAANTETYTLPPHGCAMGPLTFVIDGEPYTRGLKMFDQHPNNVPTKTLTCLTNLDVESFEVTAESAEPDGSITPYLIKWVNPGGYPIAAALDFASAADAEYALFGVTPPEPKKVEERPAQTPTSKGQDITPPQHPQTEGNAPTPDLTPLLGIVPFAALGGVGALIALGLRNNQRGKERTPDA